MTEQIDVVIADQNPVVRAGLQAVVREDGRFVSGGIFATGAELLEHLSATPAPIAIIGWSLPDMTGGDVLRSLRAKKLSTRCIVYTGERSNDVLYQSIKAGAWGFVSKAEEPQILMDAIVAVSRGRLSLPYVDMDTLNYDPLAGLTSRERELLAALAHGWTNLQIAARTGISRNTVKYHLKNLYDKLGVSNRAMAVAFYLSLERTD